MKKAIIGIDPDVRKSGVGIVWEDGHVEVKNHTFGEMVSFLQSAREYATNVVIEAGWLNEKSTWHTNPSDSKNVAAYKGKSVGRNQQVGHDLVELARVYGHNVVEVAPLKKCWHGKDGKITRDEMRAFIPNLPETNQETRDALLLAWVHSGRAIRIAPK